MAVRKPCRSRGCKSSPRCEHPWWLDVMHNRKRYRMPVDDFALARGAMALVTSKQEAEKVWEPKFIAEIVSGKDPRMPIERETKFERPTTVADLLKLYRTRYVEVEPLKSRAGMVRQLNVLNAHLGTLPATALERPDAIEDFKARYAKRAIATTNRYLVGCVTSATGRSVAISSPKRRSILAESESPRRPSVVGNGASPKPRNSGYWRRASS